MNKKAQELFNIYIVDRTTGLAIFKKITVPQNQLQNALLFGMRNLDADRYMVDNVEVGSEKDLKYYNDIECLTANDRQSRKLQEIEGIFGVKLLDYLGQDMYDRLIECIDGIYEDGFIDGSNEGN